MNPIVKKRIYFSSNDIYTNFDGVHQHDKNILTKTYNKEIYLELIMVHT